MIAGNGPDAIFGVNLDGSGLHFAIGPVPYVEHLAISSDGSKVLYDTFEANLVETGSVNFDGSASSDPDNPTLTYSYHIDPATHDLTIHETDHFVRCKPNAETFPPTASSCTAFADTRHSGSGPVELHRR